MRSNLNSDHMFCADGGVKYRGFSLDGEYYWRWVDNLRGPGTETLPFESLKDDGFQLQASGMMLPETLQGYGVYRRSSGSTETRGICDSA